MGSSEKFCLRWKDFEENLSRSFAGIRDHNKFFDCSLITNDDEAQSYNLRAHKVILSASSEFFWNIFNRESISAHPNPLIYLAGVSAVNMKFMLDFMYHGEVYVPQDEVDKFLEVAGTLKIKGLTRSPSVSRAKKGLESQDPLNMSPVPSFGQPNTAPLTLSPSIDETEGKMPGNDVEVKIESAQTVTDDTKVFEDSIKTENEYEVQDDSVFENDKPPSFKGYNDPYASGRNAIKTKITFTKICTKPSRWRCNLCSYETKTSSNTKRHFQAVHNDRADFRCQFCERKFKTPGDQRKHEKRWHRDEEDYFERLSKRQLLASRVGPSK